MQTKQYQKFETIATLGWILMDFCWMSKHIYFAYIFSVVAISMSWLALMSYDGCKKSENLILGASWMWVSMNALWMLGDEFGLSWLITIAYVFFAVTIILVVLALIASKKDDDNINFKRLKIK